MRFSLRLNNDLPVELYPRLARKAEEAGFDAIWVSNDLFLRSVWVILSAMARETHSIQLGTCIVNPFTQHPAEIAMATATLDELSGGRALLGISSGADDFLSWIGVQASHPVEAVAETVRALRRLFEGRRCHPHGEFVANWTDAAYMRFPTRAIPIYIGAMSPRMLELMGSDADGGLPLLFPPEYFAEVRDSVSRGAARSGRDISGLDLAACIWCSVSEDGAAAERALREKVAYYGYSLSPTILARLGLSRQDFEPIRQAIQVERDAERAISMVTPEMLRIGVVGTARDLIPRLEPIVSAGARHLSFGPPLGPDPFEAIDVLGREVLPHFNAHNVAP